MIDDFVPLYYNEPIFSKGHGKELWVILMEKAYAKAFGSYANIESGYTCEAIKDLTGCPYDRKSHSNEDVDELWYFIYDGI